MSAPSFSRLVRFLAKNGRTYYGDAILPKGVSDIAKATQAKVITGEIFGKHESNMPIPKFPVLFYKPITSLSGPTDPIPIHPMAQEGTGLDYECELVAVIGKSCTDVPESKALDYVLGYAVGDDVSHREWQIQRGGGQWALGKGFDGWAPYGPGIVSSQLIKDPQNLKIFTKLNGKTVQESSTKDMIFGVAKTIAFLSQGTTLLPGDLIFTGTPRGVGMGRNPQVWLKDGDVVEVGLEGVGSCINKVEFTQTKEKAKL
ncbi:Fumarylacetoacetate hydrolase domain-containing protein 2-like protein 1 [Botrytis cinerea]